MGFSTLIINACCSTSPGGGPCWLYQAGAIQGHQPGPSLPKHVGIRHGLEEGVAVGLHQTPTAHRTDLLDRGAAFVGNYPGELSMGNNELHVIVTQ